MDTSAAPVAVPIGMPAVRDAVVRRAAQDATSREASAGSVLRTAVDDAGRDGGSVTIGPGAERSARASGTTRVATAE